MANNVALSIEAARIVGPVGSEGALSMSMLAQFWAAAGRNARTAMRSSARYADWSAAARTNAARLTDPASGRLLHQAQSA